MFNFIKQKLSKIYSQVTSRLQTIFANKDVNDKNLQELYEILLSADTGVKTTNHIIERLKSQYSKGLLQTGSDLKKALHHELSAIVQEQNSFNLGELCLLVGINGSGKTTFAAKLAHQLTQQHKKVLLVAADTFRAAAVEQLQQWGTRAGVHVVTGNNNSDPAAVVYAGCTEFVSGKYDHMIIDTAGRLQTKINLMKELEKIKRVLTKQLPDKSISALLTVDAMLGQNSLEQAKIFHAAIKLDGVILTKMDGTGKGGIVFSIITELGIPIAYVSRGEEIAQMQLFNASQYVNDLLA